MFQMRFWCYRKLLIWAIQSISCRVQAILNQNWPNTIRSTFGNPLEHSQSQKARPFATFHRPNSNTHNTSSQSHWPRNLNLILNPFWKLVPNSLSPARRYWRRSHIIRNLEVGESQSCLRMFNLSRVSIRKYQRNRRFKLRWGKRVQTKMWPHFPWRLHQALVRKSTDMSFVQKIHCRITRVRRRELLKTLQSTKRFLYFHKIDF